ncbi:hypothetical protein IWQ62_000625 [Dispira parvispora]|uniref:Probable lysosomal cobalamin transporter n=1 Tax=Dispira parvispora TaxID=1520584 RepID=A0A9W8AZS9_9FUNG|nr:hypothetical protein IWQ62_000625 [Dispira parvispora]
MDFGSLLVTGWSGYAVGSLVLLVVAFVALRWLRDPEDADPWCSWIALVGLWVGLCVALLTILDVFLVSATVDQYTGLKYAWATPEVLTQVQVGVQAAQYVLLALMALLVFGVIPFVYFFYEENDLETSLSGRLQNAAKYTLFIVVIVLLLLTTGFVLQTRQDLPGNGGDPGWYKRLWSATTWHEVLAFTMGAMLTLGMGVYILYTSVGLALLPLTLTQIRPPSASRDTIYRVERELDINRQMQRSIQLRYQNVRVPVNTRDRMLLEELAKQERFYLQQLEETRQATRPRLWGSGCLPAFNLLLRGVAGCFLIVLSWSVLLSIALTSIAKITQSVCGRDCGYALDQAFLANPMAFAFQQLSQLFPADVLGFAGLFTFLVVCTFVTIVYQGIGVLGIVRFYRVAPRSTSPQALLCLATMVMFATWALSYNLATHIVPHYLTFGSQVYCNRTVEAIPTTQFVPMELTRDCTNHPEFIVPCDANAPGTICTRTQFSSLFHSVAQGYPVFGVGFFHAQWVFLGLNLLSFAVFLVKSCNGTLTISGSRSNSYTTSRDTADPPRRRGDYDEESGAGETDALLSSTASHVPPPGDGHSPYRTADRRAVSTHGRIGNRTFG